MRNCRCKASLVASKSMDSACICSMCTMCTMVMYILLLNIEHKIRLSKLSWVHQGGRGRRGGCIEAVGGRGRGMCIEALGGRGRGGCIEAVGDGAGRLFPEK